jgi:chloramphenicol 3-O phosphotransferase
LTPGQIVLLNGTPRSGKSSIARVIQETFQGVWMNVGVDSSRLTTPPRWQPGIGLRPGGERPDIEAVIPQLYATLFDSVAAHSRQGLNVVVDVGIHDAYTRPLGVLPDVARRLDGLQAFLVGVRCPIEVIIARRASDPSDTYSTSREVAISWDEAVHDPGIYDLEVDTSLLSPEECAEAICRRMAGFPPTTLSRLRPPGR